MFDTQNQSDLLFGDVKATAAFLDVSVQTVRNWLDGKPMPTAARKLLQLKYGDLSALGEEWAGFTLAADGKMYIPWFRGGFTPSQIRSMFFQVQQVRALEAQIREVKRRETALEGDLAESMRHCANYRRLVHLEARLGLMLERVTAD